MANEFTIKIKFHKFLQELIMMRPQSHFISCELYPPFDWLLQRKGVNRWVKSSRDDNEIDEASYFLWKIVPSLVFFFLMSLQWALRTAWMPGPLKLMRKKTMIEGTLLLKEMMAHITFPFMIRSFKRREWSGSWESYQKWAIDSLTTWDYFLYWSWWCHQGIYAFTIKEKKINLRTSQGITRR